MRSGSFCTCTWAYVHMREHGQGERENLDPSREFTFIGCKMPETQQGKGRVGNFCAHSCAFVNGEYPIRHISFKLKGGELWTPKICIRTSSTRLHRL